MSNDNKKLDLQIDINQAKYQIKQAQDVLDENKSFMDYIESFGLMVKADDKKIPVNAHTVCGYNDNQDLIKARIAMLKAKIEDYEAELEDLK